MITITANGVPYSDFTAVRVTVALDTMANDFSFTTSAVGDFPALKQGDAVAVSVDGELVLTGYIDEISGSEQNGSHAITYTGRDRTGDLIDSQVDVINDLRASGSLTLKRIIETAISHIGSDLKVVDALNPAPFNEAEDVVAPKVGMGAFELIAGYARKRQALLSSTPEGDVLITQSSPVDSGGVVQRVAGGAGNNILSQSWTVNASKRYNTYTHRGQLDPIALNFAGDTSNDALASQGGTTVDSAVRPGRKFVKVESNVNSPFGQLSYSDKELGNLARWSSQLARAQSTRFRCTVAGHSMPGGGVWAVNSLVQVNSDTANISRKMLLNSATFSYQEGSPSTTELDFVEKDVYTINERLLASKLTGSLFDAYSSVG